MDRASLDRELAVAGTLAIDQGQRGGAGDGSREGRGAPTSAARLRLDRPPARAPVGARRGSCSTPRRWPPRASSRPASAAGSCSNPVAPRSARRQTSRSAIATGGQVTAVLIVAAEPAIGFAVAVGSLIPIILALPYVRRESLTTLMAVSAAVGAFSLVAPSIIPWGSRFERLAGVRDPERRRGRRLRAVPALPLERQLPPDRQDVRAPPRHRDVARPGRDARSQGRRPPTGAAHRARGPRRRLRPVDLGSRARPRHLVRLPSRRAHGRPRAVLRARPLPGDAASCSRPERPSSSTSPTRTPTRPRSP